MEFTYKKMDIFMRKRRKSKYGGVTSAALKNGLMTSTTTPEPYFHGYFLVKALVIHFHWAILSFFFIILWFDSLTGFVYIYFF
ncbi:hypothetical protein HanRHA438_Chr17g0796101 [Helianthus annuus]|nr:hypothetical protein HanRHA438_Chr17g0796101 [Helianthus annuus]